MLVELGFPIFVNEHSYEKKDHFQTSYRDYL